MARNIRMQGQHESRTFHNSENVLVRKCVFCGEPKELEECFYKNGVDAAGEPVYRLDCKKCYNIRREENGLKKRHSDFIGGQKRRGEEEPPLTHQEWKEILIYFGGECAFCGATPRKDKRLTRDHLLALSKNGRTESSNIVPACGACNSSKGDEDFKDWFMKQPFFSQERLNKIFKWRTIMRQAGCE